MIKLSPMKLPGSGFMYFVLLRRYSRQSISTIGCAGAQVFDMIETCKFSSNIGDQDGLKGILSRHERYLALVDELYQPHRLIAEAETRELARA